MMFDKSIQPSHEVHPMRTPTWERALVYQPRASARRHAPSRFRGNVIIIVHQLIELDPQEIVVEQELHLLMLKTITQHCSLVAF